jgi:hypothetical protein
LVQSNNDPKSVDEWITASKLLFPKSEHNYHIFIRLTESIKDKIIKDVINTGTIMFKGTENLSELGLLYTDTAEAFNHTQSVTAKTPVGLHVPSEALTLVSALFILTLSANINAYI